MDHQRHRRRGFDGLDRSEVNLGGLGLLQMHIADRDGEGVNTGFSGKARGIVRAVRAEASPSA